VSSELDDLYELGDLDPEERARLARMHALLIAAGPPAELPVRLLERPAIAARPGARRSRPRRLLGGTLVAAAVAAVCFGSGYLVANQEHTSAVHVVRVVSLTSAFERDSFASLRVGSADANGNWPMQLSVSGLPWLVNQRARYVLMLWHDGKPSSLCGVFKVGATGGATVSFSVPYPITKTTHFVVTEMVPGVRFPGLVVMMSS
jgi:hypothetical protein